MFEITFKPELDSDSVCLCYFCCTINRKLPKSTNIEYLVALCPSGIKKLLGSTLVIPDLAAIAMEYSMLIRILSDIQTTHVAITQHRGEVLNTSTYSHLRSAIKCYQMLPR